MKKVVVTKEQLQMIKNCFDNPGTYLSEKEMVEFGPGSRWHEGMYAAAIDFLKKVRIFSK